MTAPVQEPSTDRSLAAMDWRTQQLARRPGPRLRGGDQMPTATMTWPGLASIPDDSITALDADEVGVEYSESYVNDQGLAMTPQGFDFDYHNGLITFRSTGLYHATFEVNWSDTWPAGPSYIGTVLRYFGDCFLANGCGSWIQPGVMFNSQDWQAPWPTSGALIYSIADPDNDSSIKGYVIQSSGGAKDLSGAVLKIVKLCDLDPDTGEFVPT